MTLQDEFGIVTRNREMRALYGDRRGHGVAKHVPTLPPVAAPAPPPEPKRPAAVNRAPVVPRVISDETMRRAANLEILTVSLGVSLAETSARLGEIETMLAEAAAERVVEIRHIIRVVSVLSGISIAELMSERRARHIARPRQVIMYLAKIHLGLSLPKIGRAIGNRDHTTVMHAHRKIDRLLRVGDPELQAFVERCELVLERKRNGVVNAEHSGAALLLSP